MTNKDTLKKLMEQAQEVLDIDMDGRTREHVAMQFSSDVLPDTERNLVFFGAPGTGKSFKMNKDCDEIISSYGGEYERVTFHPEYTYSQFVGVYKPTTDSDGNIKYEFVPGPFMRIYVKAIRSILTNSPQPYFLLIEEMNRARVSAVFGDIFQLLDRSGDWSSEYDVQASEDIKKFLADELKITLNKYQKLELFDQYLDHTDDFEEVDLIKKLDYEKFREAIAGMDFSQYVTGATTYKKLSRR